MRIIRRRIIGHLLEYYSLLWTLIKARNHVNMVLNVISNAVNKKGAKV